MLNDIKSVLATYIEQYRKPGLPEPELSGLYALFPERGELPSDIERRWPAEWQHSDKTGVYFIFAEDGQLLYIGKAWHLGSRLGHYFDYGENKRCKLLRSWSRDPAYVATIAVPQDMSWEAAGLEEYFIEVLRPSPKDNVLGRQTC